MTVSSRLSFITAALLIGVCGWSATAWGDPADGPGSGISVIPGNALTTVPVGGQERTQATTTIVPVTRQPFSNALHVVIRQEND